MWPCLDTAPSWLPFFATYRSLCCTTVARLAGRSWILTQPWGTASSQLPATEWALVSACEWVREASTPAAALQPALRGPVRPLPAHLYPRPSGARTCLSLA